MDNYCQRVYLVIGQTGEYSDRTDWIVAAHTDKENAKNHATMCLDYLKKKMRELLQDPEIDECEAAYNAIQTNPYDPNGKDFSCSSNFPDYWVEEVPYVRHVDEFLDFGAPTAKCLKE